MAAEFRRHGRDMKEQVIVRTQEMLREALSTQADEMTSGKVSQGAKAMLNTAMEAGKSPIGLLGSVSVMANVMKSGVTMAAGAADKVAAVTGRAEEGAVRERLNVAVKTSFENFGAGFMKNPLNPLKGHHAIQAQERANAALLVEGKVPDQMPAVVLSDDASPA